MKKITLTILLAILCIAAFSQSEKTNKSKFGVKAGYNWSYVTGSEQGFSPDTKSGFMVSVFTGNIPEKGMGYRSEIVFSRQGYTFDNGGQNTDVMNDYIYLPTLATFNISKFFQVQAGGQIGFLINSKMSGNGKDSTITDLMNRFDYGFAAGVEIFPVKGLIVGGRYNLGLGKLYKHYTESISNPYPLPFNPETTNLKNGVVQFYLGYRF